LFLKFKKERGGQMPKAYIIHSKVITVKEKGSGYDCPAKVCGPYETYNIIKTVTQIDKEAQEVFGILVVNTKNKVLAVYEISRGSLNESIVNPREVYKAALLHNAAAIIAFHNHPSGDPTPSEQDILTTRRLAEAGKILGIPLLDHIVVGDGAFRSIAELGF
jgi:DNA repair protein RadC